MSQCSTVNPAKAAEAEHLRPIFRLMHEAFPLLLRLRSVPIVATEKQSS